MQNLIHVIQLEGCPQHKHVHATMSNCLTKQRPEQEALEPSPDGKLPQNFPPNKMSTKQTSTAYTKIKSTRKPGKLLHTLL